MFGTTSFYQDLSQKIRSQDYASLGVPKETIEALDTNGGNVTPEDAQQIAMELINNPQYADLANQEMINYFTGFLKQNFNNGVAGRSKLLPGFYYKGNRPVRIPKDAPPIDTSGLSIPEDVARQIAALHAGTPDEQELAEQLVKYYNEGSSDENVYTGGEI